MGCLPGASGTISKQLDLIVVVADASNLRRNLLYVSQVIDLNKPVIVALTMMDLARKKGIKIDVEQLSAELHCPVVTINPRKNKGMDELDRAISGELQKKEPGNKIPFVPNSDLAHGSG